MVRERRQNRNLGKRLLKLNASAIGDVRAMEQVRPTREK